MSDPSPPPRGSMVVYDRMDPALSIGEYRAEVSTSVTLPGATLPSVTRYFNVEGPRFRLPPNEVAGVFPPRNAQGDFTDALPQVVLGRRTLAWERTVDPALTLPASAAGDPPAPTGPVPWLALLLIDETEHPEAVVLTDRPVTEILPAAVVARLSPRPDDRCDALEFDAALLRGLLPTIEELHLLAHVRQVNVEDRELSANDSDGWFAVIVCARLPRADRKYRACLVSLEGRTDLVSATAPTGDVGDTGAIGHGTSGAFALRDARYIPEWHFDPPKARLVLLHSWRFECTGTGTFRELARALDVGMIGDVRGEWPKPTDTGHLPIELRDRAGAAQTVWYRGPLVGVPLSRDTRGPYHSADQARRVSPETGMEDVSYATAFEVGRLLASADARLAQELMRWRRTDYRRSVELGRDAMLRGTFAGLGDRVRIADVAARLLGRWTDPRMRVIDPFEIASIAGAPGLDAGRLAEAWGIPATNAAAMLSPGIAALAGPVAAPATPVSTVPATLEAVAADHAALARLTDARERFGPPALGADGVRIGRTR